MTTDQLNCFLITAKHMNFSEAAKELYITQPAISHQISMLEKELGTRLFTRSTRKIQLTGSGELFLQDAKRILDLKDAAKERIRLADHEEQLPLNIAYLLAPCQSFLPKVIAVFKKQYPQIKLNLTRMDAKNINESLKEYNFDLLFSLSRDFRNDHSYAYKDLLTDTFCLICSEDHPCAGLAKIDFNKLASEQFIMFDPAAASFMTKQIQQYCHANHFNPKKTTYRNSMEEILFEVESGLGVTILPMKNKWLSPASVVYIPLAGNYTQIKLGVAWKMTEKSSAVQCFLDVLDQVKENHPEWF